MSYPQDLHEFTGYDLMRELERRAELRFQGL